MRILVVEDEKQIANFLRSSLEAEYFAVDVASNGEDGSYLARTNVYDLIILDNMLPKKNGIEILKEIRAEGFNTPVLVLSVRTETADKIGLLNAGADDYLGKPFSLEELLARVRALLRRPSQVEGNVLWVDNLMLDAHRHLVRRGSREVRLTRKEFALLEYLMRNRDKVLTRSMIIEHVWDMAADPFSNTIESHITTLRKKIDAGEARRLISTVIGMGYKLGAGQITSLEEEG